MVSETIDYEKIRKMPSRLRDGDVVAEVSHHSREVVPSQQDIRIYEYWLLVRVWWRRVAVAMIVAMVSTWLVTTFFIRKMYRATATLAVTPQQSGLDNRAGGLGALASVEFGGSFGFGTERKAALQYVGVLKSFAFNINLVKHNNLVPIISPNRMLGSSLKDQWRIVELMRELLNCSVDMESGNLTLSFDGPDPIVAQHIVTLYVESLRKKLRDQESAQAKAAADSLEQEVSKIPDVTLQAHVYDLIAKQIEHEALAQYQADFAFEEIEPPVANAKPVSPRPLVDTVIAGIIVLALALVLLVLVPPVAALKQQLYSIERRYDSTGGDAEVISSEAVPEPDRFGSGSV